MSKCTVETIDGHIPSARIVRIIEDENGFATAIETEGGRVLSLIDRKRQPAMDLVDLISSEIIPAQPLWFVLWAGKGEEGYWFAKAPIIAWRVVQSLWPTPLTTQGWDDQSLVLEPGGRVVQPGGNSWESFEEFKRYYEDNDGVLP